MDKGRLLGQLIGAPLGLAAGVAGGNILTERGLGKLHYQPEGRILPTRSIDLNKVIKAFSMLGGGALGTAIGSGIGSDFDANREEEEEEKDAYTQGFMDKCAAAGIDPEVLVKAAKIPGLGRIGQLLSGSKLKQLTSNKDNLSSVRKALGSGGIDYMRLGDMAKTVGPVGWVRGPDASKAQSKILQALAGMGEGRFSNAGRPEVNALYNYLNTYSDKAKGMADVAGRKVDSEKLKVLLARLGLGGTAVAGGAAAVKGLAPKKEQSFADKLRAMLPGE